MLCLGQPADIYLIDEPSAYLDSEQRIVSAKVIKRFIMHAKKTAFIVEHDFIMARPVALAPALLRLAQGWEGGLEGPRRHHRALLRFPEACLTLSPPYAALHTTPIHAPIQQATYLADRVIVYDGQPSISARAMSPQSLQTGMNTFLAALEARCAAAALRYPFWERASFGRCARRLRRLLSPPPPGPSNPAKPSPQTLSPRARQRRADYVPAGPLQLPAAHQQGALRQGPRAEGGGHLLLHGRVGSSGERVRVPQAAFSGG